MSELDHIIPTGRERKILDQYNKALETIYSQQSRIQQLESEVQLQKQTNHMLVQQNLNLSEENATLRRALHIDRSEPHGATLDWVLAVDKLKRE